MDLFRGAHIRPDADIGDLTPEILVVVSLVVHLSAGAPVVAADFQRLGRNHRFKFAVFHGADQDTVDVAGHGILLGVKGHRQVNPLALPQVYPGEHHALHAAVGLVPPLLMPVEAGRAVLIDLQAHIAQVVVIVARVHPAADDDAAPAIQSLGQLNGGFKTQGNLAEPVLHGQLVLRAAEGHAGHIFREGRRLIVILPACVEGGVARHLVACKVPLLGAAGVLIPAGEDKPFQLWRFRLLYQPAHLGLLRGNGLVVLAGNAQIKVHRIDGLGIFCITDSLNVHAALDQIWKDPVAVDWLFHIPEVPGVGKALLFPCHGLTGIPGNFLPGTYIVPHAHLGDLAVQQQRGAVVVAAEAEPAVQRAASEPGDIRSVAQFPVHIHPQFLDAVVPNH